jgi:nicotinamide mononucleotide transporter
MKTDLQLLLDALSQLPLLETAAVILGIIFVILSARESVWCWVAGFFSTLIYTYIFWKGGLFSSTLLNFYYMCMSVYGFIVWKRGDKEEGKLSITSWPLARHAGVVLVTILLSITTGYLLTNYTDANFAYLDAHVMLFSALATWMLARKIIETWIYWIFIDSMAITLYWMAGFRTTILLFIVYIVLSIYGYLSWQKHLKQTLHS